MDVFSKEKRSWVMSCIRSANTQPELAVRRILYAAGFRYRLHVRSLPGRPDIVLRRYRTCIQVHGCFWHGHGCRVGHVPGSRQHYWRPKIAGNRARDVRNHRLLRQQGWKLFVIWECDCRTAEKLERKMRTVVGYLGRKKQSKVKYSIEL